MLKPSEEITDRAKRYRAQANAPPGPRQCGFCASEKNIDIDHISGHEAEGDPDNLMYLCRSCNTRKGITQARANMGTRTIQFNPHRAPSFAEYVDAVLILRGDRPGNVAAATASIRATPLKSRLAFTKKIKQAKNPKQDTPSFAQYAHAVSIHYRPPYVPGVGFPRGAEDEGGAIIHATPPAKRKEYAEKIALNKRLRRSA